MTKKSSKDRALNEVRASLAAYQDLDDRIGKGLRKSFDEVIDGPRTGRYKIQQLEKTEKTYIGTKVEIVVRNELELERGTKLDNLIAGHEVDTKFSLTSRWMIPREARGQICLLLSGSDDSGRFNAGLLRMTDDVLCPGENQDGKKGVSKAGRGRIVWLFEGAALPTNFMLGLDEAVRKTIMAPKHGTQRVRELFRNVKGQIIPRYVVEQVAQQKDPLKRARQVRRELAGEGISVLCAANVADREQFQRLGFGDFRKDDWLSIKKRRRVRV